MIIADETSPGLSRAVLKAASATVNGSVRRDVIAALENGDMDAATAAIPWDETGALVVKRDLLTAFANAFRRAGRVVSSSIPGAAPFAVTDPSALEWVNAHGADLVTHLASENGDAVRASVRDAMRAIFEDGLTPQQGADIIYARVGLTERYSDAVDSLYRNLVEAGDPQASEKAAQRADQLRRIRATNIGRTESQYAVQGAQTQAWAQLVASDVIDGANAEEQWITAEDELANSCPICGPMDGQRVPLGDMFTTGEGDLVNAPPETHPGCRCSRVLVADGQQMGLRAPRVLLPDPYPARVHYRWAA